MDTNEIRNELSHGKVNNMFTQVMEMLEDLNNKPQSTIEIDFSPIIEKLNRILNKPDTSKLTNEQREYFYELGQHIIMNITKQFPNNTVAIQKIATEIRALSESENRRWVINETHFIIDFKSMKAVTTIITLSAVLLFSLYANFRQFEANKIYKDNDLKFRYIKAYQGISSDKFYELENIFHYNRDEKVVKEIRKNVGNYEKTLEKRRRELEEASQKEAKAEQLKRDAEKLKNRE